MINRAMETTERAQITGGYPRIYRMHATARHWMQGFAIFLVSFFLLLTTINLLGSLPHRNPPRTMALIDVFFLGYAISMCVWANRRVILYEDAIEVAGAFASRKLNRGEIRGRRMGKLASRVGGGSYYIIVPADSNQSVLKLPPFLYLDKYFFKWMATIPKIKR